MSGTGGLICKVPATPLRVSRSLLQAAIGCLLIPSEFQHSHSDMPRRGFWYEGLGFPPLPPRTRTPLLRSHEAIGREAETSSEREPRRSLMNTIKERPDAAWPALQENPLKRTAACQQHTSCNPTSGKANYRKHGTASTKLSPINYDKKARRIKLEKDIPATST